VPTDGRRPPTRPSIPGVSGICRPATAKTLMSPASRCLGHLRSNASIAGRMQKSCSRQWPRTPPFVPRREPYAPERATAMRGSRVPATGR
jgi:hypothetical protein